MYNQAKGGGIRFTRRKISHVALHKKNNSILDLFVVLERPTVTFTFNILGGALVNIMYKQ